MELGRISIGARESRKATDDSSNRHGANVEGLSWIWNRQLSNWELLELTWHENWRLLFDFSTIAEVR